MARRAPAARRKLFLHQLFGEIAKEFASKKIEILGTGCARCVRLAEAAETAARELGVPHEIKKVTDLSQIMAYGVMVTPALVVDGVVKVAGRVPTIDEIKRLLA